MVSSSSHQGVFFRGTSPHSPVILVCSVHSDLCSTKPQWYYPDDWNPTKPDEITEECSCSSGQQVCPEGAKGRDRPYFITPANEKVLNATGMTGGLADYLLRTHSDNVLQRLVLDFVLHKCSVLI